MSADKKTMPMQSNAADKQALPDGDVKEQAKRLSQAESAKLEELEEVVAKGLGSFFETGKALKAITDQGLYKPKFDTFEDYCLKRWDMSRAHAYRFIRAYDVVSYLKEELANSGITQFPQYESHVRPLIGLTCEDKVNVWKKVVEASKGQPITAALVEAEVERIKANTTDPQAKEASVEKQKPTAEQEKLMKIQKLVTDTLTLKKKGGRTVAELKQVLKEIQKLLNSKE